MKLLFCSHTCAVTETYMAVHAAAPIAQGQVRAHEEKHSCKAQMTIACREVLLSHAPISLVLPLHAPPRARWRPFPSLQEVTLGTYAHALTHRPDMALL